MITLRSIATAALAATVLAGPASAQGPAVFNWTGFYIGANTGIGFGDVDWRYEPTGPTENINTNGMLIGGVIGYNWDLGNQSLLGAEADYAWANIDGGIPCPNSAFDCNSNLATFGSLRLRAGFTAGNFLFYGTGGFAFGQQRIETVRLSGAATPPSGTAVNGQTRTATGWTGGVGVEGVIAGNLTGKMEALWYDLGRDTYTVDFDQTVSAQHTGVLFRMGLNYRFNFLGGF